MDTGCGVGRSFPLRFDFRGQGVRLTCLHVCLEASGLPDEYAEAQRRKGNRGDSE